MSRIVLPAASRTDQTSEPPKALTLAPKQAASYARSAAGGAAVLLRQHGICAIRAAADGYAIPDDPSARFGDAFTATPGADYARLRAVVDQPGGPPFERVYLTGRESLGRFRDVARTDEAVCEEVCWFAVRGVALHFVSDALAADVVGPVLDHEACDAASGLTSVEDAIRDAIFAWTASAEVAMIRRRVRIARRARAACGFYPFSGRVPYGTERWHADLRTGELVAPAPHGCGIRRYGCSFKLRWTNDLCRTIVRRIFDEVIARRPPAAIARSLGTDCVPPPAGAVSWRPNAVWRIVRNPLYAGDLVYGRSDSARRGMVSLTQDPDHPWAAAPIGSDSPFAVRDYLPDAPVDRQTWAAAQAALHPPRGGRARG